MLPETITKLETAKLETIKPETAKLEAKKKSEKFDKISGKIFN